MLKKQPRSLATCWARPPKRFMAGPIIYTNNGIVVEYFEQMAHGFDVRWISAPASEVLVAAKGAVAKGRKLLSSPFAGVRLAPRSFPTERTRSGANRSGGNVNPYLSVLMGEVGPHMDFESARKLDELIKFCKSASVLNLKSHTDEEIQAFQTADLETLVATIQYVSHTEFRNF